MKLTTLTPILQVDDIMSTIDFYTRVLDFYCEAFVADQGWASLQKDAIVIMLALPNHHLPYHSSLLTGSLYLRTDGVDAWWNRLKDKTEIVYSIENFDYGMREFAIRDCNGYILQFGQPING